MRSEEVEGAGGEVRRPTGDVVISWVMGTVGSVQGTARGDRTELKDVGHLVGGERGSNSSEETELRGCVRENANQRVMVSRVFKVE